jgi:ORF6N domain
MLDFDLAELYEVETRVLNQAIKRNMDSFPEDFMFRLTSVEWETKSSQIATTSNSVTMLSSVLKSQKNEYCNSPGFCCFKKDDY